jgi:hypothetical protein
LWSDFLLATDYSFYLVIIHCFERLKYGGGVDNFLPACQPLYCKK